MPRETYTREDVERARREARQQLLDELRAGAEGGSSAPLTLEDVKKMSVEDVIARKAEVDAVMAASGVWTEPTDADL